MVFSIPKSPHLSLTDALNAASGRFRQLLGRIQGRGLSGCSILVLVPELRFAYEIEDAFTRLGAEVVIAHTAPIALNAVDSHSWSAAILDDDAGYDDCDILATRLLGRGIPFVVYVSKWELTGSCAWGVQMVKPPETEALVATVEKLIAAERH
jgi:hypothetical protein